MSLFFITGQNLHAEQWRLNCVLVLFCFLDTFLSLCFYLNVGICQPAKTTFQNFCYLWWEGVSCVGGQEVLWNPVNFPLCPWIRALEQYTCRPSVCPLTQWAYSGSHVLVALWRWWRLLFRGSMQRRKWVLAGKRLMSVSWGMARGSRWGHLGDLE